MALSLKDIKDELLRRARQAQSNFSGNVRAIANPQTRQDWARPITQPIMQNVVKPTAQAAYRTITAYGASNPLLSQQDRARALQPLRQSGSVQPSQTPGSMRFKLTPQGYGEATRTLLSGLGADKLSLKGAGAFAGISGGLNKAFGGSFLEGATQGLGNYPTIASFSNITNPVIQRGLSKLPKKIPSAVTNRIAPAVANVVQGKGIDLSTGQQTTPTSVGLDFVQGLVGSKGTFDVVQPKGKVKGFDFGRNSKSKWVKEDIDLLDGITDYLRANKNLTQEQLDQVDQSLTYLARGYLPVKTINKLSDQYGSNTRGLLKALANELQKAVVRQEQSGYLDSLAMGLVGGQKATGYKDSTKFSSLLDKKPRFEIDDSGAKLKDANKKLTALLDYNQQVGFGKLAPEKTLKLGEILDHEELFKNYPQFKDIEVRVGTTKGNAAGSYNPATNRIELSTSAIVDKGNKSTLLHEIQHAIQEIEGFARGGNLTTNMNLSKQELAEMNEVSSLLKQVRDSATPLYDVGRSNANPKVKEWALNIIRAGEKDIDDFLKNTPYEQYKRLSGELEARAVQRRMDMNLAERAKTDPYADEARATTGTTNPNDYITRFEGGSSANVEPDGTFKAPYKRGDIKTLQNRLDDLLGTKSFNISGKWQADLPARQTAKRQIEHYASQGDPDAVKALDEVNFLEEQIANATVARTQPTKGVEGATVNRLKLTGKQLSIPSNDLAGWQPKGEIPLTKKQLAQSGVAVTPQAQPKTSVSQQGILGGNSPRFDTTLPSGQQQRIKVVADPTTKPVSSQIDIQTQAHRNQSAAQVKAGINQLKVSSSNGSIPPDVSAEIKAVERAVDKKVGLLDYMRTPDRVLRKIGLEKEATLIKQQYNKYLDELPQEINKITDWYKRVKDNKGAEQRIFRYLDGQKQALSGEELKVAQEMRSYLQEWADKLDLPQDSRIAHYITHIFEKDLIQKEFDPDLAKILDNKVAGSVYDPFLQERLGATGYVEDAFRALDAYVKRATRKYNMDPALEKLQSAENKVDLESWKYIKRYTDRINLRPTELDSLFDTAIKQSPVGYKLGQRPVAKISRDIRQMVYRGTLGLNIGSAIRNLTQGVNTYAQLGEKYTGIGYMKALRAIASKDDELQRVGVLRNTIIEDRSLSATKKFWENLDKGLFAFFEAAEKINRGSAYYGAKSRALSQGATEQQAIQAGLDMARKTQFTFGSVDTPVAMQSDLVKLATQFQSFNVKQTEFLAEMVQNKEYAGMIRWTAANLAILATVGQVMGWDIKDMIPFGGVAEGESPIGNTPAFQLAGDIGKMALGVKDEYQQDVGLDTIGNDLVPFIPGGVQIKKTIDGLMDVNRGYDQSKKGRVKFPIKQSVGNYITAGTLGTSKTKEAREYRNNDRSVLGEKQSATFKTSRDPVTYYQSVIDSRAKEKTKLSGELPSNISLPSDQETFNELYKKAQTTGTGFKSEKLLIEHDPTLTDAEKTEKIEELKNKKALWAETLIKMEQEKPEMVFEAQVKTYGRNSSYLVADRANWVKKTLSKQTDKTKQQEMVNRMWEEGVLTTGKTGTAEHLKNKLGLDVYSYTGDDEDIKDKITTAKKGKKPKNHNITIKTPESKIVWKSISNRQPTILNLKRGQRAGTKIAGLNPNIKV